MYSFRWKLWKTKVTSQLRTCPQLLDHSWVPLFRILSSLRNMSLSARNPWVPLSRILSSLRLMSPSESCPWVPLSAFTANKSPASSHYIAYCLHQSVEILVITKWIKVCLYLLCSMDRKLEHSYTFSPKPG